MSDLLSKVPLQYEPLRQNRFLFRFPSDLGIQEWWVKSASRPKIEIGSKNIPFLNTETYVAGIYKWQAITISMNDPQGPSASQACMEWIRLVAESVTGRMGYAAGYKRDLEIEMVDPTGVVVSKWILKNAWPKSFDGGSLQYGSEDLAEIKMDIVIDYAILAF